MDAIVYKILPFPSTKVTARQEKYEKIARVVTHFLVVLVRKSSQHFLQEWVGPEDVAHGTLQGWLVKSVKRSDAV